MFAVCACARFQVNPKSSHLHAVKRIFRYLKGQPKLGLWYPKDSPFDLVAYTDSDYARASLDRKSTIGDFLNSHPIQYALTVNPTIYTSCIEQFWTTAKVKTINGEVQIQALVDKKKVIITETSIRSDLQLEDVEGTECLPNAIIFEQLTLMGAKTTAWNEFSSTVSSAVICLATNQKFNFSMYIFDNMVKNLEGGVKFLMYPRFVQVFLDKQVERLSKHKEIYVTSSHTKKVFANMKRQGKDFSGRDTPLFPTMIVQAQEQKKQSRRKQSKDIADPQLSGPTEPVTDDTKNVTSVPTHFNDPLLSGMDILKLNELMELYTSLSQRVLDLEKTKTSQAAEITELKERVKKLEKKVGSRTHRLRRVYKVGRSTRVVSSEDEGLGDQEDASKKGRKIDEINQDVKVTLVDETQGRYGDNLIFDTGVLDNEQDMAEKEVDMAEKGTNVMKLCTDEVTTDSTTTTTFDELTLAQTLIEIKAAKPKAVTIAATITTTAVTRPKARGVAKDKGKAKMVKPEKPLKKKDQIMFDKEVAQKLQAQLDAELEEEKRLARQRKEDANIAE
ncbi:hypothetical protein Tco_1082574 [Tanacetum coccineum]|uniref:Uncharacterized protein n=1 Tax=Tanacetum coccineum TaxID=301880 RepID=A0ABQ5I0W9_9ASTR